MGRCSNCQFEYVADAMACARCGERLASSDRGTPERDGGATLPAWMRPVQTGDGRQSEASVALLQPGGVAAAATLPVQVRRSRVPVLSVNGPARATAADAAFIGSPAVGVPPTGDESAAPRLGNRLRLILLVAIIVALLIFILARLALHGGA